MLGIKNYWENPDLARHLKFSLNFAKKTLKLLAKDGFSHPEDGKKNIQPDKIIGETAILLLFAANLDAEMELKTEIEELAAILIPYARSEKNLVNICLYPSIALDIAHSHICLSKIGYPDPKFDTLVTLACQAHAHFGYERTPYRIIEQEWTRKLWNNKNYPIDQIIPYTFLTRPIDLLHGTREDMYAFTHALIFTTGIYFDPSAAIWSRQKEEILEEVDAMVAKCLDEQDYDLTAELLLAWPLTGTEWSSTALFALRVLAQLDKTLGFIPSPSIHLKIPEILKETERERYLYGTTYHTIYVFGLLCATIIKYKWYPPSLESLRIPNKSISEKLIHLIGQKNPIPFWLSVYNEMGEHEQNLIVDFIFNIAIIRSIARKDYEHLYLILKIGYELNLADTAIAKQAAELLDRLDKLNAIQ